MFDDDPIAPEGQIWVCLACGKKTKNRFGSDGGWDASCVLNSRLAHEDSLILTGNNRVAKIKEGGLVDEPLRPEGPSFTGLDSTG